LNAFIRPAAALMDRLRFRSKFILSGIVAGALLLWLGATAVGELHERVRMIDSERTAVAIMATLVWLFVQPPSKERSASLLSYFALWSLFGPIGQMLSSSAGPIFYERIGLGDRFSGLQRNIPEVTQKISDYLWTFHTNGEPAVGAGISAMPSLHIATVAWIFLVFHGLRSRIAPFAALFALYIFALSVALGWHYAVDGVVGALGAWLAQMLCRSYLAGRPREIGMRPVADVV